MRNSKINFRKFPGTIRELLKLLCGEDVTIILDAEDEPEHVEIEAVIGNLLVAETNNDKFKFVDIDCICAVIVDREDLLEGIFSCDDEEDEDNDNKRKENISGTDRTNNGNQENGVAGITGLTNSYKSTPRMTR
jgi:hypothetical protein